MKLALRKLALAMALTCSTAVIGCGSEAAVESGDDQDVTARPVVVTEANHGQTVSATVGQKIVLRLPSNPSTGYRWEVTETNRTFGYPKESFKADGDAPGSGGTAEFTWSTGGVLSMVGRHTVKLAYKRSFEATAAKTFEFTADIAPKGGVNPPSRTDVLIQASGDGKTFKVKTGQKIVVELESNPSTGYNWLVSSTDRTLGYPESSFAPSAGGAVGSGGTQRLTWRTDGPLPLTGHHAVELQYKRGHEVTSEKTFKFAVDIE